MSGQLFVVSGPSGAGKSTIVNALRERVDDLGYSVSHTSRKPRGSEKDGREYYFVDKKTFRKMIDEGAFAEWAEVYDDFYGTSFSSLNKQTDLGLDVLLDLDAQGARNIKRHFENSVLIYVLPPSLGILEARLKERGTDDDNVIGKRMEKAAREMENCQWYDHVVTNDELGKAIRETQDIIMSERKKVNTSID